MSIASMSELSYKYNDLWGHMNDAKSKANVCLSIDDAPTFIDAKSQ